MNEDGQLGSTGQNPTPQGQDVFGAPAPQYPTQTYAQLTPTNPPLFPAEQPSVVAQPQVYIQPVAPVQPTQPTPTENVPAAPNLAPEANYIPQSAPTTPTEHITSYNEIIGQNETAKKSKNLLSFMPNKILFPVAGLVIGIIIIAIFVAANRPKLSGANDGSANDKLVALGTLLAYGKSNVSNPDNVRTLSETSLVLSSAQNTLSASFGGIANASSSNQISADLKSKLDSAKSISELESTYHDQLKTMLGDSATSLTALAKSSKSVADQAVATKAAADFTELSNRINAAPMPTN
jgi:hypothetical protein